MASILIQINLVLGLFTTLANLVFVLCLIYPIQGEPIKQPLMLLLGTLVSGTTFFEISAIIQLMLYWLLNIGWLELASFITCIFSLSTTTTTSVWLAFFYNSQIVPAKRAVFILVKKNIKVVIYSIWFFEKMLCTFHVIVLAGIRTLLSTSQQYWVSVNSTWTVGIQYDQLNHLKSVYCVTATVVNSHYYFCMFVMAIFNSSTVFYLWQHIHRMMTNGKPVFSPQTRSQLRVTVTCALQGAMSLCCTLWSIKKYIDQGGSTDAYSNFPITQFTLIHLYMAGMTLSLGAGQAVFRQRAVNLWRRLVCCRKTRKSDEEA